MRSVPSCRQGLADLAWRPRMDDAGGAGTGAGSGAGTGAAAEAVAATAGADGLVRVWDLAAAAPSLTAVMRGHEGTERTVSPAGQGLTLVHFSAQRKRFLWDRGCV